MQELFARVLSQKDLSKAGDLFSVDDKDIENGLSEVLAKIKEITEAPAYLSNDNDQSVVEICVTRVTSAIRENGSIERHAPALVALLDSCLRHNLKPSQRDEDPPHAKIASDLMSCIFLNYSKKPVMALALPCAVKFLHQNNKELIRNLSSYLCLAAIDNAKLLAKHSTPTLQSIILGNNALVGVLPQIYPQNKEPIQRKVGALVQLLQSPVIDPGQKCSLLQLFALVAKDQPQLLEKHIPALCESLASPVSAPVVLQMFLDMSRAHPDPFLGCTPQLKHTALQQPATLPLVAQIYGQLARTSRKAAKDSVAFLVSQLAEADHQCLPTLLQEVLRVGEAHASAVAPHIAQISQSASTPASRIAVQQIKELLSKSTSSLPDKRTASSQTEGIVTVITFSGAGASHSLPHPARQEGARSAGQQLSGAASAAIQLPQSKNASTSTREINFPANSTASLARHPRLANTGTPQYISMVPTGPSNVSVIHTGSVPRTPSATVMTAALTHRHCGSDRSVPLQAVAHTVIRTTMAGLKAQTQSMAGPGGADLASRVTVTATSSSVSLGLPAPTTLAAPALSSATGGSTIATGGGGAGSVGVAAYAPVAAVAGGAHRNAIPLRDAVQQFCEKHLDKIKTYIEQVSAALPLPIKATIEESKHKKHCKLHFICLGKGEQCLYSDSFFTVRTRHHRTWVHIMFLAIQARSERAVSKDNPSVGNLKACWDGVKTESGNSFLRLVTSNFPSQKDQDALISELHDKRFFDIFELSSGPERQWECFMCQHPEKATGLIKDGQPSIEGQLKEKKGRWKFFKRWKTRHFTLTGMNITYNKKDKKASLPVTKIQSVKTIRKGARDIPKAFEIFTSDETYVLKAKDGAHAEKWIQCLQIAVARTKSAHEKVTDFDIQTWDFDRPATAPGHRSARSTAGVAAGVAKKLKACNAPAAINIATVSENKQSNDNNKEVGDNKAEGDKRDANDNKEEGDKGEVGDKKGGDNKTQVGDSGGSANMTANVRKSEKSKSKEKSKHKSKETLVATQVATQDKGGGGGVKGKSRTEEDVGNNNTTRASVRTPKSQTKL